MARDTKEILFYTPFWSFAVSEFITALEENKNKDIYIRLNSPGGNVFNAIGAYSKMREVSAGGSRVNIHVDGAAMSAAGYMLMYADYVVALDVSTILLHRAAYADEENMSAEDKAALERTNSDLKAQLSKRVSNDQFKIVTGYTIDDMFSLDSRIDITLTASQAKQLGLANEVKALTPKEQEAFYRPFMELAAFHSVPPKEQNKKVNMTKQEFIAQHPGLYAEILSDGKNLGIKAERDRVQTYMVFADSDPQAVKDGINAGTELSRAQELEMMAKKIQAGGSLKELEDASAKAVTTQTTTTDKVETDAEKQAKADAEAMKKLGWE